MTSSKPCQCNSYTKKLGASLNDLRRQNQLCDAVITVGGRDFYAHKNILAARSGYFFAMFTSGFREAAESRVTIEGKVEIFELLLDYVYTGDMVISEDIALIELLEMSCYMQLTDASQYIGNFIQREYTLRSDTKQTITMGDVYKIYQIASCHSHLKFLARGSEKHMCDYYKKLKSSDAFLKHASNDFMKKFLKLSDLSRKDEEEEVSIHTLSLLDEI